MLTGLQGQNTGFVPYSFYQIRSHDLVLGYSYLTGEEEKYTAAPIRSLEVGYARSFITYGGPHGPGAVVYSITQSWALQRDFLMATRAGISTRAWMFSFGLYLAFFTDLKYGNLKFCPEFGIAGPRFKATLGFNLPTIYNRDFADLRYAVFQLTVATNLPLVKKRFDWPREP